MFVWQKRQFITRNKYIGHLYGGSTFFRLDFNTKTLRCVRSDIFSSMFQLKKQTTKKQTLSSLFFWTILISSYNEIYFIDLNLSLLKYAM